MNELAKQKCEHCGQWGLPCTSCLHCGAPIPNLEEKFAPPIRRYIVSETMTDQVFMYGTDPLTGLVWST